MSEDTNSRPLSKTPTHVLEIISRMNGKSKVLYPFVVTDNSDIQVIKNALLMTAQAARAAKEIYFKFLLHSDGITNINAEDILQGRFEIYKLNEEKISVLKSITRKHHDANFVPQDEEAEVKSFFAIKNKDTNELESFNGKQIFNDGDEALRVLNEIIKKKHQENSTSAFSVKIPQLDIILLKDF